MIIKFKTEIIFYTGCKQPKELNLIMLLIMLFIKLIITISYIQDYLKEDN